MEQDLLVATPTPSSAVRHSYNLFGLWFESAESIPGLTPVDAAAASDPVHIEFGSVPCHLADVEAEDDIFQANRAQYLIDFPGIVRLLVERGLVQVEPAPDCDWVQVWNAILGTGGAVSGFQRGHMPLHASAIVHNGAVFAFSGQSGFGKSTLAAALVERNYRVFTDDLCLIRAAGKRFMVGEGVGEVRLMDDAAKRLGLSKQDARATQGNVAKYVFKCGEEIGSDAALKRIYSLSFVQPGLEPGIYRLRGVEAMQSLVDRLRVGIQPVPVGMARNAFEMLAALVGHVEVFRFVRPRDYREFDVWLERLTAHFEEDDTA